MNRIDEAVCIAHEHAIWAKRRANNALHATAREILFTFTGQRRSHVRWATVALELAVVWLELHQDRTPT